MGTFLETGHALKCTFTEEGNKMKIEFSDVVQVIPSNSMLLPARLPPPMK